MIKYLHDLQQSLGHRLQWGEREGLSLVRSRREGAIPVAGAESYDGRRLDFTDAEQQVKLRQWEFGQTQPQHLLGLFCTMGQRKKKNPTTTTTTAFVINLLKDWFRLFRIKEEAINRD